MARGTRSAATAELANPTPSNGAGTAAVAVADQRPRRSSLAAVTNRHAKLCEVVKLGGATELELIQAILQADTAATNFSILNAAFRIAKSIASEDAPEPPAPAPPGSLEYTRKASRVLSNVTARLGGTPATLVKLLLKALEAGAPVCALSVVEDLHYELRIGIPAPAEPATATATATAQQPDSPAAVSEQGKEPVDKVVGVEVPAEQHDEYATEPAGENADAPARDAAGIAPESMEPARAPGSGAAGAAPLDAHPAPDTGAEQQPNSQRALSQHAGSSENPGIVAPKKRARVSEEEMVEPDSPEPSAAAGAQPINVQLSSDAAAAEGAEEDPSRYAAAAEGAEAEPSSDAAAAEGAEAEPSSDAAAAEEQEEEEDGAAPQMRARTARHACREPQPRAAAQPAAGGAAGPSLRPGVRWMRSQGARGSSVPRKLLVLPEMPTVDMDSQEPLDASPAAAAGGGKADTPPSPGPRKRRKCGGKRG